MNDGRPGAIRAFLISAVIWLLQEWWLLNTIIWLSVIYVAVRWLR